MNTKMKKEALTKFASEFHISREKFEAVMKYLRDGYNKEKKLRSLETFSGAAGTENAPTGKRVIFPFFEQLSFLEPYLRKKKSFNNLEPLTQDNETEDPKDEDNSEDEGSTDNKGEENVTDELLDKTQEVAKMLIDSVVDDSGVLQLQLGNSPMSKALKQAIREETISEATQQLFPETPKQAKQETGDRPAEDIPSASKKIKLEKGIDQPSKSLDELPILEDSKRETMKDRRTKAKRESEVFDKLSQVIEQADKALGAKEEADEVALLCSRVQIVLNKINHPRRKVQWRRKFESLIADIEDKLLDEGDK